MARKKVWYLCGRKFTDEAEYIKARDKIFQHEDEQEQAMKEFGFASGYTVLAGEQSKKVVFDNQQKEG